MFGLARRMEASRQAFSRFLIATMALAFALLLAAVLAALASSRQTQRHTTWVVHTYQVETAINQALTVIERGETTRRGYLLAGDPAYRDTYRDAARRTGAAIEQVATLTRDNPRQQLAVSDLRTGVAELTRQRDRTVDLVGAGRAEEAMALFRGETQARRMIGIRDRASAMLAEEQRLLVRRDADLATSARRFAVIVWLAGALLVLLGLVTSFTLLRFTGDLAASRDRLGTFNDVLEDQVQTRTAALTRANEEIQRFAYIVSHDLRSPLVNVMGFTAELEAATRPLSDLVDRAEAEAPALLSEDARLAAREDLPEAIGFIRTSTQKMDRLINAILKLSREGRRVIAAEPLDLAEIATTCVAAIQQIVEARGVSVEIQRPMPVLTSDRVAIEQILSNLIENATKYLHPGRAGHISVIGFREGRRVIVSVIDNGRGIAPADHQRIFDLFRRSGPQDQAGEGIGLAHVRALAYRLGGTIDVESVLGEGSTFRLNLPASFDRQETGS